MRYNRLNQSRWHARGFGLLKLRRILAGLLLIAAAFTAAQATHDHPAPEHLGKVSFPISCAPSVQQQFNYGVALLHSFAYSPAAAAFQAVAQQDPHCGMAHWGIAMTYFHPLWDPPLSPATTSLAQNELRQAKALASNSKHEQQFIAALDLIFRDPTAPIDTRISNHTRAMDAIAAQNPRDVETQAFFALALLASASPADRSHANQKRALAILEPLALAYPDHPGIPHYLIHACDNAELAPRGLHAARVYATIAPSAPHALHMPSHIFTRLGLWDDSIASNIAARKAAHEQSDIGEELHAMDYLVYAYLQAGHDREANTVIQQLATMHNLDNGDFKVSYAATAMPIRYAVERAQWPDSVNIVPPAGAPPHVIAIAVWARGLGLAKTGHTVEARAETDRLRSIEQQLRASGRDYWATQVDILTREVEAWSAQAGNKHDQAATLLRAAADQEDAVEKLPVTPGPILPAREQLGYLLLDQHQPDLALKEFQVALVNSPGRRGSLNGKARAATLLSQR